MMAIRDDACSSVVLAGARVVALALAGVVQAAPTVAMPVHLVLLTVFFPEPEVATMA
jgi:hypothetical protein